MGSAGRHISARAVARAPLRAMAVAAITECCLEAGTLPITMAAAVLAMRRVRDDTRLVFTSAAMCTDTIHRAVRAGVLRRIVPGGGAAPRRWSLIWPPALGVPAQVPWSATSRVVRPELRAMFDALAGGAANEWRTTRAIASAIGWQDATAVARLQQYLLRALRGGARGVMRSRADDRLTWCWAVPVGLCSEPLSVVARGFGRTAAQQAIRDAQREHRCVAIEWPMLVEQRTPAEAKVLRQHLAVATSATPTIAGRRAPRVVRMVGASGRMWYLLPGDETAARAEMMLRGVVDAVTMLMRWQDRTNALHDKPNARSIPLWIPSFLWRIGSFAAGQLREHRATSSWRQLTETRQALVTLWRVAETCARAVPIPRTAWISWHAVQVGAWIDAAGFRRVRDARYAAQQAGVWSWSADVIRAMPYASVADADVHHGDALVERTDFLLWLASVAPVSAVAVTAHAARGGLGLQRGSDAHRWCIAQHAAREPWPRVARVTKAALCGRFPDLGCLSPQA